MLSERIAAVGGVAGAYMFPLEECKPTRPVPMIAFHRQRRPDCTIWRPGVSRSTRNCPPFLNGSSVVRC